MNQGSQTHISGNAGRTIPVSNLHSRYRMIGMITIYSYQLKAGRVKTAIYRYFSLSVESPIYYYTLQDLSLNRE